MDHSAATYAVADALAARYARLVLLTPRTQLARNVNYCSAIGIHRRLYAADAEIVFAADPVSLHDGVLAWRNVFTGIDAGGAERRAVRLVDAAHRRRQPGRTAARRWHRDAAGGRLHGAAQPAVRDP